jgi:hypothetical protein
MRCDAVSGVCFLLQGRVEGEGDLGPMRKVLLSDHFRIHCLIRAVSWRCWRYGSQFCMLNVGALVMKEVKGGKSGVN